MSGVLLFTLIIISIFYHISRWQNVQRYGLEFVYYSQKWVQIGNKKEGERHNSPSPLYCHAFNFYLPLPPTPGSRENGCTGICGLVSPIYTMIASYPAAFSFFCIASAFAFWLYAPTWTRYSFAGCVAFLVSFPRFTSTSTIAAAH